MPKKRKIGIEKLINQEKSSHKSTISMTLVQPHMSTEAHALYILYQNIVQKVIGLHEHITCFEKLHCLLEEQHYNALDYLLAHKWFYGEQLQPNRLIGKHSIDIFKSYMAMKDTPLFKLTHEQYQTYKHDTIMRQSHIRQETPEQTEVALKEWGLL